MKFTVTHLRGVLRKPSRLVLTGLAIAMAAFFAMGSLVTHDMAERSALANVSEIPSGVDYVVDGPPGNQARELAEVRHSRGVRAAVGRTSVPVVIGGQRLHLVADPGVGPLSRVHLVRGTYPGGSDRIAVSRRVDLSPGSRVRIGSRSLTVSGVVDSPSADGKAVYTTDDGVLAVVPAQFSRIDIVTEGHVDIPGAVDAATARQDAVSAARSGVEVLLAILTTFVFVSILAALLVSTSTFRIVFAQRSRQSALLRAVGAPRRRIVRSLLAEGALTGFAAGVLGTLAASGLGRLAAPVLDVSAPHLSPVAAPSVVVCAVLVTVLAALAPARAAARVSPLEALRTSAGGPEGASTGRRRIAIGVLLLVLAAAMIAKMVGDGLSSVYRPAGLTQDLLPETVASGTLVFLALVAAGPVVLGPVTRRLGSLLAPLGPVVRLAVQGIGAAPRRAATVVSVVALGTALLTGVLVGGETVRDYNDAQMAAAFPADVSVTANQEDRPLPAGMVAALGRQPHITRTLPYRTVRRDLVAPHGKVNLEVSDLAVYALPLRDRLGVLSGSLAGLGPGRIVVTDQEASLLGGITAGSRVRIGALPETVATVIVGTDIGRTGVLLDSGDLDRLGAAGRPTDVLLTAPGSLGQTAVQQVVGDRAQVTVIADERESGNDFVRLLELIALAILGLTVLIAVVGVGTTVALSVVERRVESGMLRAIGLTRGQLARVTLCEAALYGILGGACGLVIGLPHAWLSVRALGLAAPLSVPVTGLLAAALGLVTLTMAVGLLPALRAARTSPVEAMRAE